MSGAPDIFLSYNREDQAVARRFAEGFGREGLDVWWDQTLRSGEAYDQVTEQALRSAKAVVVLWSRKSVESRWVRAEATLADRQHTLVPAMIEPCERPIMFELTQTADLCHWQGDAGDAAWRSFLADVQRFVAGGTPSAKPPAVAAPPSPQASAAPRPERLSICVLPFANMSGDAEQEYFSDGISEDIITDLSKVSAMLVIARNSAFAFKGRQVDIAQVARRLNVTHVLEGSVRKAGNRVRITAQLIDGATNAHLWAERWDRDLNDIFALQDEISQAVVAALKINLLPEEKQALQERGTDNVEAYDLFLRAQAQQGLLTPQSFQRAIGLYREALELDPDFYEAWASLAGIYSGAIVLLPQSADEWRRLSHEALERARRLTSDPDQVMLVQGVQSMFSSRDWIAAGAAIDRVAGSSPSRLSGTRMADIRGAIGLFLASVGRINEAIDWFRSLAKADPLAPILMLLFTLDCAGRYEEAESEHRRMSTLPGDASFVDYFALRRAMATGSAATVRDRFRDYLARGHEFLPIHREVLDRLDDRAAVMQLVTAAAADPFYQNTSRLDGLAHLAAYAGDDAAALEYLQRGFGSQFQHQIVDLWHPQFRPARATPGFKQLVRDLGLHDYWRASGRWGDYARPVGADDFEVYR
ncbi:MAG: TIR domain-containing protein [Steroidobacteraceae bacterium]